VVFVFAFLVCHSERSERICFLPFFARTRQKFIRAGTGVWFELTHNVCGDNGEKREEADSLAALGMTNQKSKCKGKCECKRKFAP